MSEISLCSIPKGSVHASALFEYVRSLAKTNKINVNDFNSAYYYCISDTASTISFKGDSMSDMVISTCPERDLEDSGFYNVMIFLDSNNVAVESFMFTYNEDTLNSDIVINWHLESKGYYIRNLETGKLELYFERDYYLSLPEDKKKAVKSNFLFSKRDGGKWVSRAKFPNLRWARETAELLGLVNKGTLGEKLSFEEQMERKAERAEARAGRYMQYAENAEKRGTQLQSGFREAAKDYSFLTQPNINSSAGRSFTRYRERLLSAYERGFEEFKKSEYYKDKAEAAMATAHGTKPTDKLYIVRRQQECEKTIRDQKKNIEKYSGYLKRMDSGEELKNHKGNVVQRKTIESWIDNAYEIIDDSLSKLVYYDKCMSDLGGIAYSRENIKKGYKVLHKRWGLCEVGGVGPKNFSYVILEGGAKGMGGSASYAEIEEIVSTDVSELESQMHPFNVGEVYSIPIWNGDKYVDTKLEVVKVSKQRVTLKDENGNSYVRKPTKRMDGSGEITWYLMINDSYKGYICKKEQ